MVHVIKVSHQLSKLMSSLNLPAFILNNFFFFCWTVCKPKLSIFLQAYLNMHVCLLHITCLLACIHHHFMDYITVVMFSHFPSCQKLHLHWFHVILFISIVVLSFFPLLFIQFFFVVSCYHSLRKSSISRKRSSHLSVRLGSVLRLQRSASLYENLLYPGSMVLIFCHQNNAVSGFWTSLGAWMDSEMNFDTDPYVLFSSFELNHLINNFGSH